MAADEAVNLGDRIIMMNRGKAAYDFSGPEKKRLRVEDLLDCFEEIRRREQLDESTAAMLAGQYV